MSRLEEQSRAEKLHVEEEVRAERLSYLKREAELLEEKVHSFYTRTLAEF